LRISPACIGFDEVGALKEDSPEEVKGSGPVGGDKEVKIDLNDEPES